MGKLENDRRYKKRHKEKLRIEKQLWYQKNKGRINRRKREYYYKNRDVILEKRRVYGKRPEIKERDAHRSQIRVARKKNLVSDFTFKQWLQKLEENNYRCVYCYEQRDDLQREHIVPVTKGGGYTWDNIVPACMACNVSKGTKDLLTYVEYRSQSNGL